MAAPLYKRYIPPKAPANANSNAVSIPNGSENGLGKKRKHVQSSAFAGTFSNHNSTSTTSVTSVDTDSIRQTGDRLGVAERNSVVKASPGGTAASTNIQRSEQALPDISPGGSLEEKIDDALDEQQRKSKRKRRKKSKTDASKTPENQAAEESSRSIEPDKHASVMSKFEKAVKAGKLPKESDAPPAAISPGKEEELHDLVPIPRPPKPQPVDVPAGFSTLPEWIGQPITVTESTISTFQDLIVDSSLIEQLGKKGMPTPLPVQVGMLRLLLPTLNQHNGDLCVSATTGSGKTLGYVLPIVQSLRARADVRLRALVVVPTRELVRQVHDTFDSILAGTGLQLGTAAGSSKFATEQSRLMKEHQVLDTEKYQSLIGKHNTNFLSNTTGQNEPLPTLPLHVPERTPNVDILICTPGRLVDHIKLTPGFSLESLEWLVIDEADRLLDQSFQEWASVIIRATLRSPYDETSWIRTLIPSVSMGLFHPIRPKLKKIVLSATMTSDLDKLDSLRLNNPRLLFLSGVEQGTLLGEHSLGQEVLEVPRNLVEHAIPVDDPAEKPLLLLTLLARIMPDMAKQMLNTPLDSRKPTEVSRGVDSGSDSDSDSDSSSNSDSSSDVSSSSDESISLSSSESTSANDTESTSLAEQDELAHPAAPHFSSNRSTSSNALIFTNSLESAQRLSSLLSYLLGQAGDTRKTRSAISTLTKVNSQSATNKLLRDFSRAKIRVLVATDRASRGLDLPTLTHVINYDIPNKVIGYVHRVGRTARAGRQGDAWTLVEHREARWFWNTIGKRKVSNEQNGEVKNAVERVRLDVSGLGDGIKDKYEDALKQLQREVHRR